MSLSRILNDGPTGPPPPRVSVPEPPPAAPNANAPREHPPKPRGFWNQPVNYQGAGGWDPHSGEWVSGDIFPFGPGGNYYPDRAREEREESRATTPGAGSRREKEPAKEDGSGRNKRRKTAEPEERGEEGQPKRYSLRRQPAKNKQYLALQPSSSPEPEEARTPVPQDDHMPTEEELRLASSDLEDCEEIWRPELEDYILDSHRRQRLVEQWFEQSCVERGKGVARSMSHHYSIKIAQIPLPPPPPPPPVYFPPVEDRKSVV